MKKEFSMSQLMPEISVKTTVLGVEDFLEKINPNSPRKCTRRFNQLGVHFRETSTSGEIECFINELYVSSPENQKLLPGMIYRELVDFLDPFGLEVCQELALKISKRLKPIQIKNFKLENDLDYSSIHVYNSSLDHLKKYSDVTEHFGLNDVLEHISKSSISIEESITRSNNKRLEVYIDTDSINDDTTLVIYEIKKYAKGISQDEISKIEEYLKEEVF